MHYYTVKMKEQSKQWTASNEYALNSTKTVPSTRKIIATVFSNSKGIIRIDYMKKGKTITGQYYAGLLDHFNTKLKEKWSHLF